MRRALPLAVFVTAVLAGQLSAAADDPRVEPPVPEQSETSSATVPEPPEPMDTFPLDSEPLESAPAPAASLSPQMYAPSAPTFNGFSAYRVVPDPGPPGSPSYGFQHFLLPMDKYTNWYRPRAATLTQGPRCAPDPFRPRGLGHLFARPCDSFRMEYSPHTLSDGTSPYGPAYIGRQPDPRCPHCDHAKDPCQACQSRRCR